MEANVSKRLLLKSKRGFTLIEVIAVLIILGIISAVAMSRGMATDDVKVKAEVDTLKGHLRFAQYRAMNDLHGIKWGINIAGASYTLVRVDSNGTTSALMLPGDSSATHSFASGVSASVTAGSNPVLFDEWGSPGNSSTVISVNSKTITVTAVTGLIP